MVKRMTLETASEEEQSPFEGAKAQVPPADIVAYNELRSCADLFRMHKQGVLDVRPDFQREVVWKAPEQTRFIDSLMKQLPIPSMCFAMDFQAQKWIVIDGLQRMSTIIRFLEVRDTGDWRLSLLDDVEPEISGKLVSDLASDGSPLHHYFSRVENLTIPITVLRCSFDKKSHMAYLFTIFHRLNTGGTRLNNQEIRNCIYGGSLNALLRELDEVAAWRRLNKMKPGTSERFAKQELILRMFAFHDRISAYEGNLAEFLNEYMQDHRHSNDSFIQGQRELFNRTITLVYDKALGRSVGPKLPATVLEGILVGVSKNLALLEQESPVEVKRKYDAVIAHPNFSEEARKEGLSKRPRVLARLATATAIFAGE